MVSKHLFMFSQGTRKSHQQHFMMHKLIEGGRKEEKQGQENGQSSWLNSMVADFKLTDMGSLREIQSTVKYLDFKKVIWSLFVIRKSKLSGFIVSSYSKSTKHSRSSCHGIFLPHPQDFSKHKHHKQLSFLSFGFCQCEGGDVKGGDMLNSPEFYRTWELLLERGFGWVLTLVHASAPIYSRRTKCFLCRETAQIWLTHQIRTNLKDTHVR